MTQNPHPGSAAEGFRFPFSCFVNMTHTSPNPTGGSANGGFRYPFTSSTPSLGPRLSGTVHVRCPFTCFIIMTHSFPIPTDGSATEEPIWVFCLFVCFIILTMHYHHPPLGPRLRSPNALPHVLSLWHSSPIPTPGLATEGSNFLSFHSYCLRTLLYFSSTL